MIGLDFNNRQVGLGIRAEDLDLAAFDDPAIVEGDGQLGGAAGDMVVGEDEAGTALCFHDDAGTGANLVEAVVVVAVAVAETLGQVGLTVALALWEKPFEGVIIEGQCLAAGLDGLVNFDVHHRRLDDLADVPEDAGQVLHRGQLFAGGLDLIAGAGEFHVLHQIGPDKPCRDPGSSQDQHG